MRDLIKWSIFLFAACILLLFSRYYPYLHKNFPGLRVAALAGQYERPVLPRLGLSSWFAGTYQKALNQQMKEDPQIRPLAVRSYNELLFQLFHHESHEVLEMGKNGYLFDNTYIETSLGMLYKGDDFLAKQVQNLIAFQNVLREKGKHFLVLLPPSNASIFPEFYPRKYQGIVARKSDRLALSESLEENQIPYIDFQYFSTLKNQVPYPLYPKKGLHWSHYGATWAADTLKKQIESLLGTTLPVMSFDQLEVTDKLRAPDDELGKILNVLQEVQYDSMAYPQIQYVSDSTTKRPNVLVIGDSYYRVLFDLGIPQELFAPESKYWHYFHEVISPRHPNGFPLDKRKELVQGAIDQSEIIIFQASETNVHRLGFGFAELILEWETSP